MNKALIQGFRVPSFRGIGHAVQTESYQYPLMKNYGKQDRTDPTVWINNRQKEMFFSKSQQHQKGTLSSD